VLEAEAVMIGGVSPIRPRRWVLATELPKIMSAQPARKRWRALRLFARDWAKNPDRRGGMAATGPAFHRWWHRWHPRRRDDLPKIAAVVRAVCERDEHPVPGWVAQHKARRHIDIITCERLAGTQIPMLGCPPGCAEHRVWFEWSFIEDKAVHGFPERAHQGF